MSADEKGNDIRMNKTSVPRIVVCGVGGAGGNAVNRMIDSGLEGVSFVVANCDAQALAGSKASGKIQLGPTVTNGLGAGSRPEVGRAAAEEAREEICAHIKDNNILFIAAGQGGGTGTGAAPVIAKTAKDMGILTVAVVTKPFHFEGTHRMRTAERGVEELQKHVDTLIVIPNQNLFRITTEHTSMLDAFEKADEVLHQGVRGISELMTKAGLINLDFADISTVMSEMGKAVMGTGEATGEHRAKEAIESAISNPLLDDASMKGAKAILISIVGDASLGLYEVDEIANRVREEVDPEANIIFGATCDKNMNGAIRVSIVATGINSGSPKQNMDRYDENVENNSQEKYNLLYRNPGLEEKESQSLKQEDEEKPRSIFERLTGIKRSKEKTKNKDDDDDFDVPAFLRR